MVHRLDDVDGFADVADISAHIGADRDADFYICGPGPFMDVVEAGLAEHGVAAEQIFIERFESPEDHEVPAAAAAGSGAEVPEGGALVSVHLEGEVTDVPVPAGQTILQAVRAAGLDAPFACEDGYCGCCMAKVKSGEVEMRHNDGGVDEEMMSQGWVLTCQSETRTPKVEIEYPD